MPEVGLEPHSGPYKHWELPKTYAIRASPADIRPSPKPKVCISNDGIGCVAAWLQVCLTLCEEFVLTMICPPQHNRSKRGGQVDMTS